MFYSVKEKNFDDSGNRRKYDREFSKKAALEIEVCGREKSEYRRYIYIELDVLKLQIGKRGRRLRL